MRFYLVDRIVEMVPRRRIRTVKLVSLLDPILERHPSAGVVLAPMLALECMNQSASWMSCIMSDHHWLLVPGVWRRVVASRPAPVGDRLDIEIEVTNWSDDAVEVNGEASSRGEPVLRAEGGLFFYVDAEELEDPQLTRRHYRWISGDNSPLPEAPPAPTPIAGVSVGNPGGYHWVPYDAVDALVPGEMVAARKSVVLTDDVFVTHFRRTPIVPGVFLVQSMVDVCRALLEASPRPGGYWHFEELQGARFRRRVVPGDLLQIQARLRGLEGGRALLACEGLVGGEQVVSLRGATFRSESVPAAGVGDS
ncbi:MAG: hypothetical protein ACE149_09075 [Armatimonadota bacterium]